MTSLPHVLFGGLLARPQAKWKPVRRPEGAPARKAKGRPGAKVDSTFADGPGASKAARMEETHLTQLGREAKLPASPEAAVLERVANPHPGETYLVRFAAPEFTSLCPVTGQPDFAHLVIDYVP